MELRKLFMDNLTIQSADASVKKTSGAQDSSGTDFDSYISKIGDRSNPLKTANSAQKNDKGSNWHRLYR